MNAEDIKTLLDQVPFVPFRILLTNGQSFEVRHRDFLWVFRHRLLLAVTKDASRGIVDHAEHIALLHVARIEELTPAAAA